MLTAGWQQRGTCCHEGGRSARSWWPQHRDTPETEGATVSHPAMVPMIITDDLSATRAFYVDDLGCRVTIEQDAYLQVRFGDDDGAPEPAFFPPMPAASPLGSRLPFAGGMLVSIAVEAWGDAARWRAPPGPPQLPGRPRRTRRHAGRRLRAGTTRHPRRLPRGGRAGRRALSAPDRVSRLGNSRPPDAWTVGIRPPLR